ncbi:COPII coat Sec23p-Sfb3p heterodimer component [Malassezia obtusa]|uniref:COPII coat Sec23p-Sfb3p heterodimer component n=1 Tax=Malassezia obtusa TaxID=76774 RepID=A0AAF0DZA9_9BASI|nr:COPII coat Sec23p-Sfb3p heterodimer component [Malassezia obtusa]
MQATPRAPNPSRSPMPQARSPRPPTAPLPPRSPRPPTAAPGGQAPPRSPRPPGAPLPPRSPRPPARSPAPGARPAPATGLEGGMNRMAVGGASTAAARPPGTQPAATPSAPPARPPMGPARSKRAARAYHQDAAQPASSGWNDVTARPPPPQAAWQQDAVARANAHGGYTPSGPAVDDDEGGALDQIPGQRNSISQTQLAANRAAMAARTGG